MALQHLLRGCRRCWEHLASIAADADADEAAWPDDQPLSMALWSGALGIRRPIDGRFARLRPLHRHDAWMASRSPVSLARLILHETLATVSRYPRISGAEAFEVADGWLQSACIGILRPAARRDLSALSFVYRASVALARRRPESCRRFLDMASVVLLGGEGRHEPKVTWWTVRAELHRRLAMDTQGAERSACRRGPEDRGTVCLAEAAHCLRQALRMLPIKGHDEQRIELLHQQALVCRQQGRFDFAERLLDRARQLFDALEDGTGGRWKPWRQLEPLEEDARWS